MVQTRFIIILLHNHFGVFSPDSYQGKAVEEPGQEKSQKIPLAAGSKESVGSRT